MGVVGTPHFAWPFQRGANGKVQVVEQGTVEHVAACENMIVRCPVGWRLARPEFGWRFPTFKSVPLDMTPLTQALRTWEPRGDANAQEYADAAQAAARDVLVEVDVNEESNG